MSVIQNGDCSLHINETNILSLLNFRKKVSLYKLKFFDANKQGSIGLFLSSQVYEGWAEVGVS